jgi:2-polyprenyl-6-methoxyphenol hydroxylase-like FAD-dependent oxidoreductase
MVLLGDAAHALPSTLGLGASMGLTNALDLARTLDGAHDIPAALVAWDARRRPLAEQTQRWAEIYDALTVRCPKRLNGVRNAFVKLLDVPAVHRRVFQPGALAVPDDV